MVAMTQEITRSDLNTYISKRKETEQVRLLSRDVSDHIWELLQHLKDVRSPSADLLNSVCSLVDEFDLDHSILGEELCIKVDRLLNDSRLSYHSRSDLELIASWRSWQS